VKSKYSLPNCATRTHKAPTRIQNQLPRQFKIITWCTQNMHTRCTRDLAHRHLAASTRVRLHRLPVAQALPPHRRAPRLLVIRPHGFYLSTAVRRDYSSPGRTGSTSTSPCAASTRFPAAAALHRLRRTPPRRRLLGVRLPRLLTSTSLNQKTSRGRLPRHQQLVESTSD
jgi:hypothetical protein